jgi:hypothetical protein
VDTISTTERERMTRSLIALLGLLTLASEMLCSGEAEAGTYFWTLSPSQSGDWPASSNWSGAVPSSGDYAVVANGGTATITLPETCGTLSLGSTAGVGSLLMSGGSLYSYTQFVGDSGTGNFTQSGGTNSLSYSGLYVGNNPSSSGSYNLSGGSLYAPYQHIGFNGSGSFTQSGGTNGGNVWLGYNSGSSGSYNLSGGALYASQYIGYGGSGNFAQSGGTNSGSIVLGYNIGGSGSYILSGGSLNAPSQYVGYNGTGSFTQSGGTNSSSNNFYVGYSSGGSGSYNLGSGLLYVSSEYLGYNGTASFTQSGGTNSAYNVYLGCNTGSSGNYNLSGGSMGASTEHVGYFHGTGSFTQSGGTNMLANPYGVGIYLGENSGSGSYNFSGGLLVASYQFVGASGVGSFIQSGGSNSAGSLYFGYNSGSSGAYALSGGSLLAGSEFVGESGTGSFTQSGGTNSVYKQYLYVGDRYGSSGSYNLSGGLLLAPVQYIAYGGAGNFTQSGGTNSASYGLFVGNNSISGGSYNLSGGSLFAARQHIGYSGTGSFVQSGGTNSISGSLSLGDSSNAVGSYNLTGGSLYAVSQYVGSNGIGSFTQSGGTNSVSGYLIIGSGTSSSGSYNLSGTGQLFAANEYIGTSAMFQQTGGVNSAALLSIGSGGYYRLSGGTLIAGSEFVSAGTLDGGGGTAVISIASSAITDWSQSKIVNMGLTTLAVGGNSLLIVPPSFDPAAVFGSYSNAGILHTAGTVLTVPAGQGLGGTGTIADPVSCQGTVTAAGGQLNLSGGLNISGTGTVNLSGSGSLTTQDGFSGIAGGSLFAANQYVGYSGNGSFTQSDGTSSVSKYLYLGYSSSGSGNYKLSGGSLAAPTQYIGYSGSGGFTQSGGTNSPGYTSLYIGYNSGSSGSYSLSGSGLLCANNQYVGYRGAGTFTQFGGTNSPSNYVIPTTLYLGYSGGSGTYNLSGGSLYGWYEYVGYGGAGSFTQSGGTNTISGGLLYLGYYPGTTGSYSLSGSGNLSAPGEYVGYASGSTAQFQQNGGINSTPFVSIGSGGKYQLTGGTLAASSGFAGALDGGNSPGAISIAGPAIVDLSRGSIVNTGSTSLAIGANSLLIVPPGMDPAALFGSYYNAGMIHTAGTVLSVSAGQSFGGTGTIVDPVNCQGSITAVGGPICLSGGLNLSGTGAVNLGASGGTLVAQGSTSGIISGSLVTGYQYVGYNGSGGFTQAGGTNWFVNTYGSGEFYNPSPSGLFLGYNPGSSGSYNLSGGSLYAPSQYVGYSGVGSFTQSGGTNSVGGLYLGYSSSSSSGSYNLSGGSLYALYVDVGNYGSGGGTFTQSGGTNSSADLYVGYADDGSFRLSGGLLYSSTQYIGYEYMGSFTQSGGTNSVSNDLFIGLLSSESASYSLSGSAVLTAASESVGSTSLFKQSGGMNSTTFLSVGNGAKYIFTGGTLLVSNGLVVAARAAYTSGGTLDCGNRAGVISVAGPAIVNLSQVVNAASTSLSIGPNSLLIVPPGMNPAAIFGSYSNAGMVHTAGTVLSVSAGQSFGGTGFFLDPVNCEGSITAVGGRIFFDGGLNVSGTGAVDISASSGTLSTDDSFSGIAGGSLVTEYQSLGGSGTQSFTQSDGTNSILNSLYLGSYSSSGANYILSGSGLLAANFLYIGYTATGSLTQSGGTNLVGSIYLGKNTASNGTYSLSGSGQVSAASEYLGFGTGGTALFQQSGGINNTTFLSVGNGGRYVLTGGTLAASNGLVSAGTLDGGNSSATISVAGPAIIDLTHGTIVNTSSTSLAIGANSLLIVPPGMNPAAIFGSYSNAGMVHATGTVLTVPAGQGFGGMGTIADPVNCQGAITAVGGLINITGGLNVSGTGAVNLGASGGTLITNDSFSGIAGGSLVMAYQIVGYASTGSFTQSAGTNSVSSTLYLGYNTGDSGGYYLSRSGVLSANSEYVGYRGKGGITQSGGTNLVGSLYVCLGYNIANGGSYDLLGSALLSATSEYIGSSEGVGNLTQSGGTNSVSNALTLGYFPGGNGGYFLNGGLLSLAGSGLTDGGGTALFYFSGGTLQAGSSWSTTIPISFPAKGGAGTFDTNGHTLTLKGQLSGAGGLVATGGGMLILSGSNNYSGPTSVASGTLIIANAGALPNGADLTVGEGWLFTPATSSWVMPISGNWSDASKWTGGVPNAAQTTAVFSATTSAAVSIGIDEQVTLRGLQFGNAGTATTGYTLSGSGSNTLTLNNSGSDATIVVTDGTHFVNAPVVLDGNLLVTSGGTGSWTVGFGAGSNISDNGAGYSLTMNGSGGKLVLSGTNSYTGGTFVESGTLVATNPLAIADGTNLTVGNVAVFPAVIALDHKAPIGSLTTAVPEPGSFILVAAVATGLFVRWRSAYRRHDA